MLKIGRLLTGKAKSNKRKVKSYTPKKVHSVYNLKLDKYIDNTTVELLLHPFKGLSPQLDTLIKNLLSLQTITAIKTNTSNGFVLDVEDNNKVFNMEVLIKGNNFYINM